MTPEDVARLFPGNSLTLARISRGSGNERRFVWMAQWYAGYYTSDTDRHIYHDGGSKQEFFGDTPEEALRALVLNELSSAKQSVTARESDLAEARTALDAVAELLAEVKP